MVYGVHRSSTAFLTRTPGWMWPAAAFVVCGAVVMWPRVAPLAVGACVLLVCAWLAPRFTVGLALLAILFVRTVSHVIPVDQLAWLDESAVVLCAVVFPLRRLAEGKGLRAMPGQVWFVVFALAGLVSALAAGVPSGTLLLGGFLLCKGVLFGWAVAQIDWAERHLLIAARTGVVVICVCLAAVAVNLAVPDAWSALLANRGSINVRLGLPSLIGPFVHPLDLGQIMAASCIALLAWRAAVGKRPLTLFLMIATGAAALLSFRRTAISGLLTGALSVMAKLGAVRLLLIGAVAVPIAGVLLFAPLQTVVDATYKDYVVASDTEARTVLTRDSFNLAVDRFPLGAGFGRFGSQAAVTDYSPEYVARGYPAIWGLGPTKDDGQFLTDTEWPAIVGETGLVGAVAFALGLVAVYLRGHRVWSSGATHVVRWAGLMATGWVVAYVVASVANVVFTGPPAFGLLFGLAGVLASLSDPGSRTGGARDGTAAPWRSRIRLHRAP